MNQTMLATILRGSGSRSNSQNNATSRFADPGQKIGIEFELEDWAGGSPENHWSVHSDASLRNGIEFVFNGPKYGTSAENALSVFERLASVTEHTISERTSTHIHMDMGDGATVGDARKMFILTYLIEPAMFRMADENRKWCSYCQPLSDMTQARISGILTAQDQHSLIGSFSGQRHQDKYYAFNLKSLMNHTTIEFRYFPGYRSMEEVDKWINLVQEVKLAARSVPTLEELLAIGVDASRLEGWLRSQMPRSVGNGLISSLDISDAVKRAGYLNAIMATSDLPTAPLHQRLQQVQPDSSAAKMLTALFSLRFDRDSQRTAVLRSVLRNRSLSPDDLDALRTVVSQVANGREFERLITQFLSNENN